MHCLKLSLRGAKRRRNLRWKSLEIASLTLAMTIAAASHAQPNSQRLFETYIAPDLHVTWAVVDDFPAREQEAQSVLEKSARRVRALLDRLDPLDPFSEMALLLSKKEAGTFDVSPELAQILYTTREIGRELGEPMARKIKVDLKENQVKLKSTDVIINIEPLLKGFLADQMMHDLIEGGFPNSFLNVETIFVSRGMDFNGPWKIRVVDQTRANASRAFLYNVTDASAATIWFNQAGLPLTDLKSVTVFTKSSASEAQGAATAAMAMGLANAKKFLEDLKVERAVLIDHQGRFHQIPEEEKK